MNEMTVLSWLNEKEMCDLGPKIIVSGVLSTAYGQEEYF